MRAIVHRIRARGLTIIAIALCVSFVSITSAAQSDPARNDNPCDLESFYHAHVDRQQVFSDLAGAVFRISVRRRQDETELISGSGYLIDAKHGYLLTALHVVDEAFKDPKNVVIEAENENFPGQKFELAPKRQRLDIALLQFSEPSLVSGVTTPDIALWMLGAGAEYSTIGYPRGKETPNKQGAELQGRDTNNMLDVKQSVDNGSSGSPLIDENGAVVATCTDKLNSGEAIYTPLIYVQDLLLDLPPSDRIKPLDVLLKSRSTTGTTAKLIQKLKWRIGNPSNLELLGWTEQLAKNRTSYNSLKSYAGCPLVQALVQRRLGSKALDIIAQLAPQEDRATLLLQSAYQALTFGDPETAEKLSGQSVSFFGQKENKDRQAEARVVLGVSQVYKGDYREASASFNQALAEQAVPRQRAQTQLYLSQAYTGLSEWEEASRTSNDALTAFRQTGDVKGQASALSSLGDIELRQGNTSAAVNFLSNSKALCASIKDRGCEAHAARELASISARTPSRPSLYFSLMNPLLLVSLLVVFLVGYALITKLYLKKR